MAETLVPEQQIEMAAAPDDNDAGVEMARKQLESFNPDEWDLTYETKDDTLYLRKKNRERMAVSYFVPREPLILVNLEATSAELIGADIQHFRRLFIKRHPEARHVYEVLSPSWFPWRRKKPAGNGWATAAITLSLRPQLSAR